MQKSLCSRERIGKIQHTFLCAVVKTVRRLGVDDTYYVTAGINHIWYEVVTDVVIDSSFISSTVPFFDSRDLDSLDHVIMVNNQSFLMRFYLEGGNAGVYGWAELVYDSAVENDRVGIIAGRYEKVPEPATILLFGLGGFGAWLLRRNREVQNIGA